MLSLNDVTRSTTRKEQHMMQESLALRLRVLRAQRRATLRDVEAATGVAKETLSELERGRRRPKDITLAKLADYYGVPLEELIEEPVPLDRALVGEAEGRSSTGYPDVLEMDDEQLEKLRERAREDDSEFAALLQAHSAVAENVEVLRRAGVSDEDMGDMFRRHVILRKLWKVALFERLHSVPSDWPGRKPEAPEHPDTTALSLDDAYAVWFNVRVPAGAR